MPDQNAKNDEVEGRRSLCWRVWVSVLGRRDVMAVADIVDVPTAEEAVLIVVNTWTNSDWDSEAFAYLDRAGNWHYYRLLDTDGIVVERVVAD